MQKLENPIIRANLHPDQKPPTVYTRKRAVERMLNFEPLLGFDRHLWLPSWLYWPSPNRNKEYWLFYDGPSQSWTCNCPRWAQRGEVCEHALIAFWYDWAMEQVNQQRVNQLVTGLRKLKHPCMEKLAEVLLCAQNLYQSRYPFSEHFRVDIQPYRDYFPNDFYCPQCSGDFTLRFNNIYRCDKCNHPGFEVLKLNSASFFEENMLIEVDEETRIPAGELYGLEELAF